MKKKLLLILTGTAFITSLWAQETPAPATKAPDPNFDKKWRFGLRVTPQPCWFGSGNKENIPAGARLGIGFGLNVEYRFSEVAGILTGIGGDFEGGNYKFKYDPDNNYQAKYWMDAEELALPGEGNKDAGNLEYTLKDRTIKTTHVTIPFILKLSTQEYSGIKYFGMFGVELGIRVKSTANDNYYRVVKYKNQMPDDVSANSVSDIDIRDETSLVPARLGLNAGLGGEYRLGGTTSMFISVNYFYSFTNLMRKVSDYTYYRSQGNNFTPIEQSLKQNAIRINLGIMF